MGYSIFLAAYKTHVMLTCVSFMCMLDIYYPVLLVCESILVINAVL